MRLYDVVLGKSSTPLDPLETQPFTVPEDSVVIVTDDLMNYMRRLGVSEASGNNIGKELKAWNKDQNRLLQGSMRLPFPRMWIDMKTKDMFAGVSVQEIDFSKVQENTRMITFHSFIYRNGSFKGPLEIFLLGVSDDGYILSVGSSMYSHQEMKMLHHDATGPEKLNEFWDRAMGESSEVTNAHIAIQVALRTVGLMNLKNIAIEDGELPARSLRKQQEKKLGHPLVQFKEIVVKPMSRRKLQTVATDEKANRSWHVCRGHFAEYTEDKPMFGKYSGRFWIPPHTRGDADVGEIKSQYRVELT